MSLTSLMVYVDAHEAANERIELAGALADRFDAMLIGMSALALRPPVVVDGVPVDGVLMQAEIKNIKAKLAEKGNWFRAIACRRPPQARMARCTRFANGGARARVPRRGHRCHRTGGGTGRCVQRA